MKEVEHKDMPEVAGGQVDSYGNPLQVIYPIYPEPLEQPVSPLIVPEDPLP